MMMDAPDLRQTIHVPSKRSPGAHTQEHELWVRVLHMALHDALSLHDEALSWVGTWPSRDFHEVCRLAGVDGDWLWHRLRGLIDGPAADRKAALKAMGMFSPEGALRRRSERISASVRARGSEGKDDRLPAETHP